MALRYPLTYTETNDVLDPTWFNYAHNELASELNGYLDRDNIGVEVISEAMLVANSCNLVTSGTKGTLPILPTSTMRWQATDAGGDYFNQLTVTATVDCVLRCEWSGTWNNTTPQAVWTKDTGDYILQLRLTVDGTVIADSGPISYWFSYASAYLIGVIPVTAGAHVVQLEARTYYAFYHNLSIQVDPWQAGTVLSAATWEVLGNELIVKQRRR